MLTETQLKEIKEHLEKASNPLFFFDNDIDGLCSFLIFSRYIEKGKGVAIKSFPELDKSYIRKIHELNPDYIFVLDKPIISQGFIDEVKKLNLPLIWLDHHDVQVSTQGTYYYNPTKQNEKSFEPVTYSAYQVTRKKSDLWLFIAGCISDNFFPEYIEEFKKNYPELLQGNIKTSFQALYETDIGKIARILGFALKDRTSNVVRMIKFLLKVKAPQEILQENEKNFLLFRYNQVNKKYQKLIKKALKFANSKLLYFQYGGLLSLSSDIANELSYKFPEKFIVVAYIKGTKANISIRGKNAKEITLKAISGLENATGGGHEQATGCKVSLEDLPKFKERIEKLVQ